MIVVRLALVVASAHNLPVCMCGSAAGMLTKLRLVSPLRLGFTSQIAIVRG